MSILNWKNKVLGHTYQGGGKGGGGGGGPQQVTSTSTTSNIPEYARPYVENMLDSTQKQIYNDNLTGFKPYQPYSTDVNNYFAGFSPLQQQAQQGAANLQTPGQIGFGSDLTAVGGLGALGTAGQMANAGNQYQNQATSMYGPGSVGAYMNPYLAQSLAPQLQQLNQQFGIKGAQEQGAATSAGAFGGSRNALMQGLNQQNQQMAAQQAIAQGYDKAFQQAQQAQQFGANLGLQGQQGALQGFGQTINAGQGLGQLGSQQLAAQQGVLNTQSAMGAQQQQLEQNKINQAIQDYATAQQYPFMQLGMMNAMLRGLPMQNMSTQQYQATPSYLTQGLGAVGTLAGAYKAFGQKEGGIVGMKEGGKVPSYAGPQGSVVNSVRAKLEELASQPGGIERVKQIAQTSPSDEVRKMAAVVVAEHMMQAQAEQQVTPAPQQAPQMQSQGIAALPAPSMDSMAGGGIIAFAGPDGSQVEEDEDLQYLDLAEKQRKAALERSGITGAPNAKMKEYLASQVGALPGMKESERGLMMMDYFSNLGTQTGPLGYAALKAAKDTTPSFRKGLENIKKAQADVAKGQSELENADRLDALGLNKEANELRRYAEDRLSRENIANVKGAGNMANYAQNYLQEKMTAGDKRDPAAILREGMDNYMSLYGAAGSRAATAATVASGNIRDKAVDNVTNTLTKDFNSPEAKEIRRLAKKDKKEGTNTAQVYKDSLVKKEMERIQPSSGGGGDTGASKKPKVIKLD
jgi:hypothetical protein